MFDAEKNDNNDDKLACMQVWSGNHRTYCEAELEGITAWIYSSPYGTSRSGGDIHFLSSCATGRVTRILLADVSGHGEQVSHYALELKRTMHRYINHISQRQLVKEINQHFSQATRNGRFATAVALSYFSPTGELHYCNAGHPSPLHYHAAQKKWQYLEQQIEEGDGFSNLPLGILKNTVYQQSTALLEPGDLILLYTDGLIETVIDNKAIGLDGLLEYMQTLNVNEPSTIVSQLAQLSGANKKGNNNNDDCTLLLLSITHKGKLKFKQKLLAPWFAIKSLRSALKAKDKLPLPLPEFSLRNIGGYFFHWFHKK